MQDTPNVRTAHTLSVAGIGGGVILFVIDCTLWLSRGPEAMPYWMHSLFIGSFVLAILVGVVLQVGIRQHRMMRRIMVRLEALEATLALPQNGKVLDIGARIASKLAHE